MCPEALQQQQWPWCVEDAEAEKKWAAQRTRFAEAEKTGFAKDSLTYKEQQQQKPINQQKAEPILFA